MKVSSLFLFVSAFLVYDLLPTEGSADVVQRNNQNNMNDDISERILSDTPPPKTPHPKPQPSGTSASGSDGSASGSGAAATGDTGGTGATSGGAASGGADAASGGGGGGGASGGASSGGGSASSSSSGGVAGSDSTGGGGIAGGGGGVNAANGSFVGPAGGAKHTGALVAVGVAAVAGAAIATAFTAKRRVETTTPDHPLKGSLNRRINLFSHLAGTSAANRQGADGSYVNADEVIV